MLISFENVFAKHEFDLGSLTETEHGIYTGDALTVKHRMHRILACFAEEEEAHLKEMLVAGVIKESVSD